MNIFYLDTDLHLCAKYHTDKHVVKMIVEYAQLLSTAHRVIDGTVIVGVSKINRKQTRYVLDDGRELNLYKATHINHPSAKWTRHCMANYQWLFSLFCELLDEYNYRYGKNHACERLIPYLASAPSNISTEHQFSPPWRAMPDEYKVSRSELDYTVKSYRAYYNGAKKSQFKWKNREIPPFVELLV